MPKFSTRSAKQLRTCAWDIQKVFKEVIKHYPCTILNGHTNEQQQAEKVANKVSKTEWPNDKQNAFPAYAVAAAPFPVPRNWNKEGSKDITQYYQLAAIVKFVGKSMGIAIRWRGDEDLETCTFEDLTRFEL